MGDWSLQTELLWLSGSEEDHCPPTAVGDRYYPITGVRDPYYPPKAVGDPYNLPTPVGDPCYTSEAVRDSCYPPETVRDRHYLPDTVGDPYCPPTPVKDPCYPSDTVVEDTTDHTYCSSFPSPCNSPSPLSPRQKGGRSALTWKTLNQRGSSFGGRVGGLSHLKLFPSQVAMWAGVLKLVVGALMAALGGAALAVEAALAPLGGGLWAGAVVGLSGFLAVCAARRPRSQVYTVSLAGVSLLSLSASALLLMLSVAAWAADTGAAPPDFLEQVGLLDLVPPPPTTSPGLSPAVLVSGGLILLAVLDCLVSSVCIAIAARHMCRALGGLTDPGGRGRGQSEGHNRKERLYRWLGQQKTIFPIGTATTVASRGPDAGGTSCVPSVCQFVPLTESSSNGSLDHLASHDELSVPLSSHCSGVNIQRHAVRADARNNNRSEGLDDRHHDASLPYARGTPNIRGSEGAQTPRRDGRFTYLGRHPASDKQGGKGNLRGGNTYAKYAHLGTSANGGGANGRYEASSHYDVGPYKSNNSQNPYSRRSLSGKLSHSALYSGNSTLHSTLASSSTRPGKGGLSTTTKNSTGSSQLTTSAYLSSSSESRHAKSTTSSPVKPRPKSTNQNQPNLNHFPSLPHIPPSSSSMVVMAPPPPSSYAQYAPVHQVRRPASERYYSLHQVSQHQRQQPPVPQTSYFHQQPHSIHYATPQHLHQLQPHSLYYTAQQQPAQSGYYMVPNNVGDHQSMNAYQSLPHPRAAHYMPQPYQQSVHPSLYYTHLPAPMMPANYHHLQDYDKRKTKKKKKSRGLHSPVHSSKLTKKMKTKKSSIGKKSRKRKSRELTDEQIEETYTGLDRTIAEGFIGTMMEPAMSNTRPIPGYCR